MLVSIQSFTLLLVFCTIVDGLNMINRFRRSFRRGVTLVAASSVEPMKREIMDRSNNEDGEFAESFIAQKNFILLDKFLNPVQGNITLTAEQFVNFCDESFNIFLNERIAETESEADKASLGKIRYEINVARKNKLIEADKILRGVLTAGGLKQMEAKLYYHLKMAQIDMAFMVILQLNIEDAQNAKAETALQVMTHLQTLINEHQDKLVSAPVRLLRLLVRADDPNVRKQMLRQKLLIGPNLVTNHVTTDPNAAYPTNADISKSFLQPRDTMVPQCESIVVKAVESWGGADVDVAELEATIADVLEQVLFMLPQKLIDV